MNDTTNAHVAIFFNSLCQGDFQRMTRCLNNWQEVAKDQEAFEIGYNPNSGYAYVALENNISIGEAFNGIEYICTNTEDGEEFFFSSYAEALEKQEELNKDLGPQ